MCLNFFHPIIIQSRRMFNLRMSYVWNRTTILKFARLLWCYRSCTLRKKLANPRTNKNRIVVLLAALLLALHNQLRNMMFLSLSAFVTNVWFKIALWPVIRFCCLQIIDMIFLSLNAFVTSVWFKVALWPAIRFCCLQIVDFPLRLIISYFVISVECLSTSFWLIITYMKHKHY